MKQFLKSTFCVLLSLTIVFLFASCLELDTKETQTTTTQIQETTTRSPLDSSVSETLRAFYTDTLPSMAVKSGVKDSAGQEIRCLFNMVEKTVCTDFDGDGAKEIVVLYDISKQAGKRNLDVALFLDEENGEACVADMQVASYGAALNGETYILTRYAGTVCRVRFISKSAYEAVLVQIFANGGWHTSISAYRHISYHDSVRLDSGTCYIDHGGEGLYKSVTGQGVYTKEKYLNYKTPTESYNSFITNLLSESMLP